MGRQRTTVASQLGEAAEVPARVSLAVTKYVLCRAESPGPHPTRVARHRLSTVCAFAEWLCTPILESVQIPTT